MKHFSIICVSIVLSALALTSSASFAQDQFQNQSKIFTDPNIESFDQFRTAKSHVLYDSLDSFIIGKMNQWHYPGLQACIINKDSILWKGNYGYANIAQNKLVDDSTLFIIESCSKPVTATAVMQLWEQGLFGLDDNVNNYLPFAIRNPAYPFDPITFRMLLTHTSSIADNWYVLDPLVTWGGDYPDSLESFLSNYLLPGGNHYMSSNWYGSAPGSQYNYCSVSVSVIGLLVEILADTSFEDYCQGNIFGPLGMTETSWFLANLDTNTIATPYVYSNGNYIAYPHWGEPIYPAAQIRTSALQMARFIMAFIGKGQVDSTRILQSSTVDSMTTVQNPQLYPMGLTWFIFQDNLPHNVGMKTICGHSGSRHFGANTGMAFILNEDIGVVVLANGAYGNFSVSNQGIIDIAYELLSYGIINTACTPGFLGDVTNDDNVNSTDALIVLSYDAGLPIPQPIFERINIGFGDVNEDGVTNSTDALIILSYDAGILVPYPVGDPVCLPGNTNRSPGLTKATPNAGESIGISAVPTSKKITRRMSVNIPVIVDMSQTSQKLGSYTAELEWNPEVFEFISQSGGITEGFENPVVNDNEVEKGKLIFAHAYPYGADKEVNLLNVQLKVVGEEESSSSISLNFSAMAAAKTFVDLLPYLQADVMDMNLESVEVPNTYSVLQYPNPFNPTTNIEFSIPKAEFITLKIYNILGEEVATLVSEKLAAGSYKYDWDASKLASGVYLYRIQAGNFVEAKKMVLLK